MRINKKIKIISKNQIFVNIFTIFQEDLLFRKLYKKVNLHLLHAIFI
jgi:hypothetical protein